MQHNEHLQEKDERPILELIQKIKDELVEPRLLSKEERQQCVEVLLGEGMNESTIAQILKRSEKTIYRDMSEIRQRNAVVPSIELAKQMTGELLTNARIHHAYLMRIARNKESSASDKIQAELSAWRVLNELVERLQNLGYLPMQRQAVTNDVYYHMVDDSEKSFEEIKGMITEIETISSEKGGMPKEIEEEIGKLKTKVSKAELLCQVTKVSDKCKEVKPNEEDQNEK